MNSTANGTTLYRPTNNHLEALISPQALTPRIGACVEQLGMAWYNTPIPDFDVPGSAFETSWPDAGTRLRQHLAAGRKVLVHCRGGLGRSGMIAARLLAELGIPPADAVRQVRRARPGAIETDEQEDRALSVRPVLGRDSADPAA